MTTVIKLRIIGVLLLCFVVRTNAQERNALHIDAMSCSYRNNPIGMDDPAPLFSWSFSSSMRNQYQSSFQVIVSSSQCKLAKGNGDIWNSGKISSSENINVLFKGVPLQPFTRYYWKVRVWNEHGDAGAWSKTAFFETAFLNTAQWKGAWICDGKLAPQLDEDFYGDIPAPLLIKNFQTGKKIQSARLYISGLGYYEAYINGHKAGDQVIDPGWTNYGKTVLYAVYDVSNMLNTASNSIKILLGNGWYNPLPMRLFSAFNLRTVLTIGQPKVIANLRITFTDGSTAVIATDSSWKTRPSHILKNNVYLGETQDGRLEKETMRASSISKRADLPAQTAAAPGGALTLQTAPPIRVTKRIPPISITEPGKDSFVVDMGQNFAGWIRMNIHAQAGAKIHFRYGELIFPNGHVNGMTTVAGHIKEIWNLKGGPGSPKTAYQEDEYSCRGDGQEVFQPHFTFHAFRYVEITGLTQKPSLADIEGLRLNADLPIAGNFTCSDTLLNRIQQNTLNSFLSNIFSVQSDCPGREKQGYGADMVVSAEAFLYNYDMRTFYAKTVNDFANDVRPNGGMPECAPYNGIATDGFAEGAGPLEWQLAFSFLQQQLYSFYGNKEIIEANYEKTKGMVEFLRSQSKEYLINHGIGDHVSIDPKHIPLTSGSFYFYHVKLLTDFALLLEQEADALHYKKLGDTIAEAFNHRYLNEDSGTYDTAFNQITQVFPIWNRLVPAPQQEKAFSALVNQVVEKRQGHFSTGIFGTKMLFDVLRKNNRDDITLGFVRSTNFPGYGYMIKNGATTLWETWEKPDQNSWNHPMFGSVSEWFYRSLLGINQTEAGTGFRNLVLKPYTTGGLHFAKGYYQSPQGKIISAWERSTASLTWDVTIPPNTKAKIYVPAAALKNIKESNRAVEQVKELSFLYMENGFAVFNAVSGAYHFRVE